MKCLYCDSKKTEVKNSRPVKSGAGIWRRRYCPKCGSVFTTRETALADNLFVTKKSKKRQRFVYEKLLVSIFSALNTKANSDNGTNAKLAKDIADSVIAKVIQQQAEKTGMTTRAIIIAVYRELKKRGRLYADHFAYYSEYRLQVLVQEGLIKIG